MSSLLVSVVVRTFSSSWKHIISNNHLDMPLKLKPIFLYK